MENEITLGFKDYPREYSPEFMNINSIPKMEDMAISRKEYDLTINPTMNENGRYNRSEPDFKIELKNIIREYDTRLPSSPIEPIENSYKKPSNRIITAIALGAGLFLNSGITESYTEERRTNEEFISIIGSFALNSVIEDYKTTSSFNFSNDKIMKKPFLMEDYSVIEPVTSRSATERASHRFRSARMRSGVLGEITRALQKKGNRNLKKGVSDVVQRHETLTEGTQSRGELHRAYAPLIAGLMGEPTTAKRFMKGIDKQAAAESGQLKTEARSDEGLAADVIVIGAGAQAAIFNAEYRSLNPDARVVSIDKGTRLGGQFRSHGERAVFRINSRNFRRQDNNKVSLPGGEGNLNTFGPKAPVQLTDISRGTYATNVEMGATAAINQYLSAETMLGTEFVSRRTLDNGTEEVTVLDLDSGELMRLTGKKVVILSGPGERSEITNGANHITAEELFAEFGDAKNKFPMEKYVGKTVVLVGGGDTGRVVAEIFMRLGPEDAYGKSTVQMGGPEKVYWFGTSFETRDEFCQANRPRYQQLASFIPEATDDNSLLEPSMLKVFGVGESLVDDKLVVTLESGEIVTADFVIEATGLETDVQDKARNGTPESDVLITRYIRGLGFSEEAAIGRRVGSNTVIGGSPAKLPLTQAERETFADGITENTLSIWANQARLRELAKAVDLELKIGL